MRLIAVLLLAGHGIAHTVGFLVSWKLIKLEEMSYSTTVLGGSIDLGDRGMRIMGLLWLIVGLLFVATGAGLLVGWPLWRPVTLVLAVISLLMCILGWPESKIGVVVNAAIVVFVALGGGSAWMGPS